MKVIDDLAESPSIFVENGKAFFREKVTGVELKYPIKTIKARAIRFSSRLTDFMSEEKLSVSLGDEVPSGTFDYYIVYVEYGGIEREVEISSNCPLRATIR
jgi:hypothetical protein